MEQAQRSRKKQEGRDRLGRHAASVIFDWRTAGAPAFTRESLAALLGTSVSTVVRWENPKMCNPRLSELWAMETLKGGLVASLFADQSITFFVPAKTVSEANTRSHWSEKAKRTKGLRVSAAVHLMSAVQKHLGRAASPKDLVDAAEEGRGVEILMVRLAPGLLDDDNLGSALKGFRDGIADAFGKDDRDPVLRWKYDQRKAKTYGVEVVIRWTPRIA